MSLQERMRESTQQAVQRYVQNTRNMVQRERDRVLDNARNMFGLRTQEAGIVAQMSGKTVNALFFVLLIMAIIGIIGELQPDNVGPSGLWWSFNNLLVNLRSSDASLSSMINVLAQFLNDLIGGQQSFTITRRNPNNNNVYPGRAGWTPGPDLIVLHWTQGWFSTVTDGVENGTWTGSSYHFVISWYGEIAQTVDIRDRARANRTHTDSTRPYQWYGSARHPRVRERERNANDYTISIAFSEIGFDGGRGELPSEAQRRAAAWLILHIRNEVRRVFPGVEIPMNRDHIIGHDEIVSRICPGPNFPWNDIISRVEGR